MPTSVLAVVVRIETTAHSPADGATVESLRYAGSAVSPAVETVYVSVRCGRTDAGVIVKSRTCSSYYASVTW